MKSPFRFRILRLSILMVATTLCFVGPSLADTKADVASGDPKARAISTKLNEEGAALARAGKPSEAEQVLKRAMETDPNNLTAVFNLASIYMNNKKTGQGIALLEQYVQRGVSDPAFFARLGDGYFATRNVDQALDHYERAAEIDPEIPGLARKLGTVYVLKNRLDDAERMFLRAAEQEPKNEQIFSNLSSVFLANGNPSKAVSTAKRGLQVRATSDLYLALGNAYEALGDSKNSLIAYKRAADLGDQSKELKEKITQAGKRAS